MTKPCTSCGVAGMTTRKPGIEASHASYEPECCGPALRPAPPNEITVSGTFACPPDM